MNPAAEKGFSLVEVIITIVIIGIALVAAISGWGTIARHSADVMWQTKVSYLGQAYLEEILSRRFDENTPVGGGSCSPACSDENTEFGVTGGAPFVSKDGESRENFDDVDDYDGIDENAVGLFVGLIGQVEAYNNYSVSVDVSYVGTTYLGGSDNQLLKEINVTVTPPANTGQGPVVFSAIKGSY